MNLANEASVRLAIFCGMLLAFGVLEAVAPRRTFIARVFPRRINNLLLLAVSTAAVRLIPVLSAVGVAAWARSQGWGLMNVIDAPGWLKVAGAVALLDMMIYWQHVACHRIPALWRFHKVHHADLDLDATSALRFHPGEIVLSAALKCVVAVVIGAPPEGLALFEIVLNGTALFNHANLALPSWLDAVLRLFVVTPDMHRVHHSVDRDEANMNYGFNLPWWDRMFGTYLPQPAGDHASLKLGLAELRDEERHQFTVRPDGDALQPQLAIKRNAEDEAARRRLRRPSLEPIVVPR